MTLAKKNDEIRQPKKKVKPYRWILQIVILTFMVALFMSAVSETTVPLISLPFVILVLLLFVFIGVAFDTVGIAITTADKAPFASMAARRIFGADKALYLLTNSEMAANICNDVVGDVCGIMSGATGVAVVAWFFKYTDANVFVVAIMVSSITATLTVAGKAFGKVIATKHYKTILLAVGRFLRLFKRKDK